MVQAILVGRHSVLQKKQPVKIGNTVEAAVEGHLDQLLVGGLQLLRCIIHATLVHGLCGREAAMTFQDSGGIFRTPSRQPEKSLCAAL